MPTTHLPVGRALLGTMSAALLGGCALIFNYGNYEESVPGGGGAGGGGAGGGGGTAGTGASGCGAGGADAGLGTVKWLTTFGSDSGESADYANSLAVSPEGEVYFTAQFAGDVQIGPDLVSTGAAYVMVLAKLDALGEPRWGKKLGERTPVGDKGKYLIGSLAVGSDSQPFVGGSSDAALDVGMGLTQNQGYSDVFLGKIDGSGSWLWGSPYGDGNSQFGETVAVGSEGNVVMTGHYIYGLQFPNPCALPSTDTGAYDVFVTRFDSAGACMWARNFGNTTDLLGMGVAADAQGHVAVVGKYMGSMTVDALPATSSAGGMGTDNFLVVLDESNGEAQRLETRESTVNATVLVAAEKTGGIFWAGNVENGSPGGSSVFVEKLDPAGWKAELVSSQTIIVSAIDADDAGHLLLTGLVIGDATFGGETIIGDMDGDAFVLSLDSATGSPLAVTKIEGPGGQYGAAIRHDPKGGAVVLGSFGRGVKAGCETRLGTLGSDVFVAKLGP
jgi:hypothetical protein